MTGKATVGIPGLFEPDSPVTIALARIGASGAEVRRVGAVLQVLVEHMLTGDHLATVQPETPRQVCEREGIEVREAETMQPVRRCDVICTSDVE